MRTTRPLPSYMSLITIAASGHNTRFAGSYKFKNGFFAGIDFYTIPYDYEGFTVISPGYAYDLGKKGYIALSADHGVLFDEGDYDMDYSTDKGPFWLGS